MNELKTESGIVVMSNSSEDQALRLQAVRIVFESNSIAKLYTIEEALQAADVVAAYIKGGKE